MKSRQEDKDTTVHNAVSVEKIACVLFPQATVCLTIKVTAGLWSLKEAATGPVGRPDTPASER